MNYGPVMNEFQMQEDIDTEWTLEKQISSCFFYSVEKTHIAQGYKPYIALIYRWWGGRHCTLSEENYKLLAGYQPSKSNDN